MIDALPRFLVKEGVDVARPKLDKVMVQLTSPMSHFAVAEAWKILGIEDKGNYLIVTSTLHTVTNIYDNPPPVPYLDLVRNQHETFAGMVGVHMTK